MAFNNLQRMYLNLLHSAEIKKRLIVVTIARARVFEDLMRKIVVMMIIRNNRLMISVIHIEDDIMLFSYPAKRDTVIDLKCFSSDCRLNVFLQTFHYGGILCSGKYTFHFHKVVFLEVRL